MTITDMQNEIAAAWAQLDALRSQKSTVLTALISLTTGGQADVSSVSQSGDAGSESYSRVTLTEQLNTLVNNECVLRQQVKDLYLDMNSRFPYIISTKILT